MSSAALAPWTRPSSRLLEASRLAPWSPELVTSPAAQRPGRVVRPSSSIGHAADHVVGAGADGDAVLGDVEVEPLAERGDAGEAFVDERRVEVRQVEVDVGVLGLRHLGDDRAGDVVARGEFGVLVIIGHEPIAVAVAEEGPLRRGWPR